HHALLALFSFFGPIRPRALHSFPTRRSSDLEYPAHQLDAFLGGRDLRQDSGTHGYRAPSQVISRVPARAPFLPPRPVPTPSVQRDRKSTRLNSSHVKISYAVFCLKKKKTRSR